MWFLIFILAAAWFLYQARLTVKEDNIIRSENSDTNSYPCDNPPPGKAAGHKWVLKFPDGRSDHRGYLICKKCGHIPGEQ